MRKRFTRDELALYDGSGNKPALIAVNGKVYDVTSSFLWQNGRHQVLHSAGKDLTVEMEKSPHGIELLEKFPIVGEFSNWIE